MEEGRQGEKLVCGDLNVCLKKEPANAFSQGMEDLGLSQVGKEATHVLGGQIDHLYVSSDAVQRTSLERISPFFSDHDGLCFTLGQSIAQVATSPFPRKCTTQLRLPWRLR